MRFKLVYILILSTILSCSKDNIDRIPEVYVSYRITLQEFNIKSVNGLLIVNNQANAGVAGLLIYKRADGAIVAYDRCSTVNPQKRCAVVPDDPNLTATDPCSGAKFSLFDGNPVKAPAQRSLKQYRVIITNFDLMVVN